MKTPIQQAMAAGFNAQTLAIEGCETLALHGARNLEEADAAFHSAMTKLVAARAAVREALRERDGLPTIESTRRAG